MRPASQQFSSIIIKIGSSKQRSIFELALLESHFVTNKEAETKCLHGIRVFKTYKAVKRYNNKILNLAQRKIC
ncbi:hypothetical protein M0804_014029 [Polistes exclamans]|nr:hypothetical protein M0804_014029 [Polistes exclamans]